MSGAVRLVFVLCLAQSLGMLGFATFPALMPGLMVEWQLSNTEAGIVNGAYFGGYMASVAILVLLTDRFDALWVFLSAAALSGAAQLGFALLADGFLSAAVLHTLMGIGLAGVYMPGLRVLTDRLEGPKQSRYIAFYTATFGIGSGLSFLFAGIAGDLLGWRWAFGLAAAGAWIAGLAVAATTRPLTERQLPVGHLLDVRPVLRSPPTMGYILGYAGHVWELFALRGWLVAYLTWVAAQEGGAPLWLAPTLVATVIGLVGVPASIVGNEIAMRAGRRRTIACVMLLSAVTALALGALAGAPYWLVCLVGLFYGIPLLADSASLTAGAIAAAPAGRRGATLALHSTLGFGAGFLGTTAVGIALDLAGGASETGWMVAFATMALGALFGPFILWRLGRRPTDKKSGQEASA
ncbi:MAG: MFS transporter [Rhodospirillaceae bacterium]|nr:MFS transporter [Rhodospirillaceae bacterium]MDE0617177.1 MFS transporter [Rhodospirillaceae bacterium]